MSVAELEIDYSDDEVEAPMPYHSQSQSLSPPRVSLQLQSQPSRALRQRGTINYADRNDSDHGYDSDAGDRPARRRVIATNAKSKRAFKDSDNSDAENANENNAKRMRVTKSVTAQPLKRTDSHAQSSPSNENEVHRTSQFQFSNDELLDAEDVPAIQHACSEQSQHIGGEENKKAEAGIVTHLHIRNFMSHQSFDIDFNPHITFITGRNGAGKSAILHALQTVFGCRAIETTRGSSMASFIRWESKERQAVIEVSIKNGGSMPWLPTVLNQQPLRENETVSDLIRLKRTLTGDLKQRTRCSSAYHILVHTINDRGQSVKQSWDKCHSRDIQSLCDYFNIQPSNPCVVLNQETSKKFLAGNDDHRKYEFFTRATQLDVLKLKHDECERKINLISDELGEAKLRLAKLIEEEKKLREWVAYSHNREAVENEVKRSHAAVEFAGLETLKDRQRKDEQVLERQRAKLHTFTQQLNEMQNEAEHFEDEKRKRLAAVRECERMLEETRKSLRVIRNNNDTEDQKLSELRRRIQSLHSSLAQARAELQRHDANIQKMIAAINAQNAEEDQKRDADIAGIQSEIDELKQQQVNIRQEKASLLEQQSGLSEEMRTIEGKISQCQRQIEGIDRRLNELRAGQQTGGSRFGSKAREIRQLIQQQSQSFREIPLGPLGDYVKIKEGQQQWAQAVETCLGRGQLQSYVVTNTSDRDRLRAIFNRVGLDVRHTPSVSVRVRKDIPEFVDRGPNNHDFTPHLRVIDCVTIENGWAYNTVIDLSAPELSLLLAKHSANEDTTSVNRRAAEVAKQFLPVKGFRGVFTADGTLVVARQGGTSFNTAEANRTTLLASDLRVEEVRVSGQREPLQHQIIVYQRDREQRMQAKNDLQKKVRAIDPRLADVSASIADLSSSLSEIERQKQSLRSEADLFPLQREKQRCENEVNEMSLKINDLENKLAMQETKCEELGDEMNEAQLRVNDCQAALTAAQSSVTDLESRHYNRKRLTEEKQREYAELKLKNDQRAAYNEEEGRKLAAIRQAIIDKFAPYDEDILSDGLTIDQYRKQARVADVNLKRVENELANLRAVFGQSITVDAMIKRHAAVLTARDTFQDAYRNIRKDFKLFTMCLGKRKAKYNEYQRNLAVAINQHYRLYLKQNGRQGQVLIDHEAKTLTVTSERINETAHSVTQSQQSGSRSLSGGEMSYSTVSFLMALWRSVDCPWRAMDEFDVYQDTVNRDISMNLLITSAARTKNRQFMFLTPLDVSKVKASEWVSIRALNPPDRSQGRLPFEAERADGEIVEE